jgi:hypothetical protein
VTLPWWAWAVLVAAALLLLSYRAGRTWRAGIREELVGFLDAEAPGLEVVDVRAREIVVRSRAGGERTLPLEPVYADAAKLKAADAEGRRQIYRALLKQIRRK